MYNNPSDPYSQYPGQQPAYPPSQPGFPQPDYSQPTLPQSQPVFPQPGYSQPGFPPSQPGYFEAQPGFPQLGSPQPRKSRVGIWIMLVVLLLLLGGGGVLAFTQLRSTPQKTISAYCDGLQTSNTQEIYDNLSSAQRVQFGVHQIQQALAVFQTVNGVKNCALADIQENDPAATGRATLTFGNGSTQSEKLTFIQENGTWRVSNMPISTPQQTLQDYCTAFEHGDAQGLYNTLSAAAQGHTSVSEIQTGFQELTLLTGGITNCTMNNLQANGSSATATVTFTPVHGQAGSVNIQLVAESGAWKIDSSTTAP